MTASQKVYFPNAYIIHCTGYASAKIFNGKRDKFTLWKSHVLLAPRIEKTGFMFIDPGEVSVMPQGKYCVVCQSQEDTEVNSANFDVINQKVVGIQEALIKVMPSMAGHGGEFRANACLKPSIHTSETASRNRDIYASWISDREIVAIPGKATLAPILGDLVAQMVVNEKSFSDISERPGDGFSNHFEELNTIHGL